MIGVTRLGFQIMASPQTAASIAFQAQTAAGKLNAVMMPMVPIGCHCSYMRCEGRSLCMVSPWSCRERPTAKSAMSTHSWISPIALGSDLAHLERDEIAERLEMLAEGVPDAPHEFAALRRRKHPPFGLHQLRSLHRGVVGVGADQPDRGQRPPVARIETEDPIRPRLGGKNRRMVGEREPLEDAREGRMMLIRGHPGNLAGVRIPERNDPRRRAARV